MRLLLDTHALLWWLLDDSHLAQAARDLIADPGNDVIVSVVSLWEIQVKIRAGKLEADVADVLSAVDAQAFELLPIHRTHIIGLATLPMYHRDPFDHLLMAQGIVEGVAFVSEDRHARAYPVQVVRCS